MISTKKIMVDVEILKSLGVSIPQCNQSKKVKWDEDTTVY
jgi:hypothetical protein